MRAPDKIQGMGSMIARATLVMALLAVTAATSHAAMHGNRGSGGNGAHAYGGGGGRAYGGSAYRGGGRAYGRGTHVYGGGGHVYGGGGYAYGGGGSAYGGSRYLGGGTRVLVHGGYYGYGGPARYYGHPHYGRPYSHLRFGVTLGGFYYPPAYVYDVEPAPVYVEPAPVYVEPAPADDESAPNRVDPEHAYDDRTPSAQDERADVDVTNEPPAGCYYYDPFCDQRFSTLDDYTEHVRSHRHSQTISIVETSSGKALRTLEFVGGYWRVRK